jgi:hypothetical protein
MRGGLGGSKPPIFLKTNGYPTPSFIFRKKNEEELRRKKKKRKKK